VSVVKASWAVRSLVSTNAPFDLHMSHGWQEVYTVALVIPLVLLVGYALQIWVRDKDVTAFALLIGGAASVIWEPIVDVLGKCWYPQFGQVHLFETFGRPIPLYVLFGYTWFMGGLTIVAYRLIQAKGMSALWRLYPILILIEAPFELLAVHTHVYVYYGHQPLSLSSWPIWWGFVNTSVPIAASVLLTCVRPKLTGWTVLLVIPMVPMLDGAANAATAWPVWTVLHASVPAPERQIAGVLTCLLGILVVATVVELGKMVLSGRATPIRESNNVLHDLSIQ
jgi:hypothetical protein